MHRSAARLPGFCGCWGGGSPLVPALHSQAHTLKRACVHGSCMPVIYDGTQHSSFATAAPSCGQGAWICWCWLCCAGMLVAWRESRRWCFESVVRWWAVGWVVWLRDEPTYGLVPQPQLSGRFSKAGRAPTGACLSAFSGAATPLWVLSVLWSCSCGCVGCVPGGSSCLCRQSLPAGLSPCSHCCQQHLDGCSWCRVPGCQQGSQRC